MNEDRDLIICRCEEVTKGEILEVMEMGAEALNEVKRLTRAGMGLCQGRICRKLVMQIYGEKMRKNPGEIKAMTYRPPVRPIPIEVLATAVEAMDLGLEYQIEGKERELIEEREEAIKNNSNVSDGDAKIGQGKEVVEIIFENPRRQR